jgi:hypothetical protein
VGPALKSGVSPADPKTETAMSTSHDHQAPAIPSTTPHAPPPANGRRARRRGTEVAADLRGRLAAHRALVTAITVGLIILVSGAVLLRAAIDDSVTTDEIFYVHTGACAFNTGLVDLEPTNPAGPKLLAGIGAELSGVPTDTACNADSYQSLMQHASVGNLRRLIVFARIPAILITLALILVSALWAYRLAGPVASVLAAAFVGFDPTIMAHGHLATLDVPLTFGFVSCLAALWQWHTGGRRRWLAIAGLALGFALLSKAGAVILIPVAIALIFATGRGGIIARLRRVVVPAVVLVGVAYVVVTAVYAPFGFSEPTHAWLPTGFNWLVPESWLWGAHWQLVDHISSAGNYISWLNGQQHLANTWLYFPEAFLLKTTIASLCAMLIGVAWLAWRRSPALVWVFAPGVVYFAVTMKSGINIGIRYLAPSIALFSITAAVGLALLPRAWPAIGGVLAVAAIAATLAGPVGSIGYFNAFATGRHSYYLADSNIDWGQDGWRLRDWWQAHGKPLLEVDLFGGLPASYYVPTAIDVGGPHNERWDYSVVAPVPDRLLITSVNEGTLWSTFTPEVAAARCYIGTSLVVVGAVC